MKCGVAAKDGDGNVTDILLPLRSRMTLFKKPCCAHTIKVSLFIQSRLWAVSPHSPHHKIRACFLHTKVSFHLDFLYSRGLCYFYIGKRDSKELWAKDRRRGRWASFIRNQDWQQKSVGINAIELYTLCLLVADKMPNFHHKWPEFWLFLIMVPVSLIKIIILYLSFVIPALCPDQNQRKGKCDIGQFVIYA